MECYFRSNPVNENGRPVRGYRQRLHREWKERGLFEATEQRICDQARAIRKNNWLTEVEIEAIKRRIIQDDQVMDEIEQLHDEIEYEHVRVELDEQADNLEEHEIPNEDEIFIEENTLNDEDKDILKEIVDILKKKEFNGQIDFKKVDKFKLNEITKKINNVIRHIKANNITEINNILRAASAYAAKKLGLKEFKRDDKKTDPWWKRRIQGDIKELRKDVNILERKRKDQLKHMAKYNQLDKKYRITNKGLTTVIEELKQRITAKASKIKRFDQRITQYRQNRTFNIDQKKIFKELDGNIRHERVIPDAEESKRFWSDIWSKEKRHNNDAEWLDKLRQEKDVNNQNNISITRELVNVQCRKMPNWKAPGLDGVQGYWLKNLNSMHEKISLMLDNILNNREALPAWMTCGKTILCLKDPIKGNAVNNFRPITCLPLMWKLLTGIISESMYSFLDTNGILPEEQKGCRKNSRGTKDQLLIDKTILRDCKRRQTNLGMAWIDYKKAYDMVPHSWIMECMGLFGISENITNFIKGSMTTWKTTLMTSGEILGEVEIKRGIFQGDSLSPLLFVLCMIPLTLLLRKIKAGYEWERKQFKINHLLFMDDLKLFGKNEDQIDSLVNTVHEYSKDIGMEFGLNKCGLLIMKRGKVISSDGIELADGGVMRDIEESGYKYLGILEFDKIKETEMKVAFVKEYQRRLKLVLKSKLNGKNKIKAINVWAVSVLRYGGGIIKWNKEEMQKMDRQTRKTMTMYGALHPKSDVQRIYVARSKGGRGLISCEQCVRSEENSLGWYIRNSAEHLLKAVKTSGVLKN